MIKIEGQFFAIEHADQFKQIRGCGKTGLGGARRDSRSFAVVMAFASQGRQAGHTQHHSQAKQFEIRDSSHLGCQ